MSGMTIKYTDQHILTYGRLFVLQDMIGSVLI